MPGVISGITLVFLPAVSSCFIPKLLGGGDYVLVGNLIENYFISTGDWNFGSAISLIMAVIIMISMFLTKKVDYENKGKPAHEKTEIAVLPVLSDSDSWPSSTCRFSTSSSSRSMTPSR